MALFEHTIMLRQDLSSSDLIDALKSHEQMLNETMEVLFTKTGDLEIYLIR